MVMFSTNRGLLRILQNMSMLLVDSSAQNLRNYKVISHTEAFKLFLFIVIF